MKNQTRSNKPDKHDYKSIVKLLNKYIADHASFTLAEFMYENKLTFTQAQEAIELGEVNNLLHKEGDMIVSGKGAEEEKCEIDDLSGKAIRMLNTVCRTPGISRDQLFMLNPGPDIDYQISAFTELIDCRAVICSKSFGCYSAIPKNKVDSIPEKKRSRPFSFMDSL